MSLRLSYGTVRESPRQAIYAVRVHDEILDLPEIDDINRPFWEATRRGELRLQRCKDCREAEGNLHMWLHCEISLLQLRSDDNGK